MKWSEHEVIKASEPKDRIDEIIALLLSQRGLKDEALTEEFLHPVSPLTINPKEVGINENTLNKSIGRIRQAMENNETVLIYGDYDADGITATAVLWETIHGLGGKAIPFIPNRERHGYGLSIKGLEEAIAKYDPGLIITVDNGIVAHEAAEYAAEKEIDLIITDHHQKGETLPISSGLVHTDKIAGSGVAWFVAKELSPAAAEKTLELVAIGTVADMLPLTGANRSIVKHGLEKMRLSPRPGLNALLQEAGVEPTTTLDTYHVSYLIAPRLNAMGRLEEALDSLRLLCTKSAERAEQLAHKLGDTNRTRQDLTLDFIGIGEKLVGDTTLPMLIVEHESFHEGVIGLVAGKLTEKYYRPSIVISKRDGISKASARSIRGVNIIEMIRNFNHMLVNAGGHPMAAGFTIETEKIDMFTEALRAYAKTTITAGLLNPILMIDCEIRLSDIRQDLFQEIELLRPFGIANPQPVFSVKGAEILDAQQIGKEKQHLRLRLKDGNRYYPAIGFGMGQRFADLKGPVDLAFTIQENVWNGKRNLQLVIKDLLPL